MENMLDLLPVSSYELPPASAGEQDLKGGLKPKLKRSGSDPKSFS
jgi:hypothetical protein